ncbi:hypothetical protein AZI85_15185 [Bdellovibrio bacteriovorus]|uniref:Uncharacterized protein n=1 Tax=Bdellovibrio bacteriovorus TaxID=959 RepID=A0A150WUB6_BDEBC|nr:hypothetical protein [Bdellovibrio bacteriovorus]KYG70034.1 hypothetical protein AZI85_15185 [Bdellovibrio bacteriovorus]BFD67190.1 hypothetical protein HAGR004_22120 [Bdellovibrio sp. HAGR004]
MSLFDDLKKVAEEGAKKAGADISVYLANQVSAPFVKIAQDMGANLTVAQIEAGKTPAPPTVAPPNNTDPTPSASFFGTRVAPWMLLAAVGVGAFFIFKRR